ncbi:unnamed protein product [Rhizoctonia solani]|uniref:SHSP domain-containing protein n=1 Tax=Rhizoctonia solani TaxID=456999 RepID=A0A8H2XLJ3_9AGAM|nr:unnamed protein product [Rhizoctonia solani]
MSFSAPMSPPTNLSPMDISPSGGSDSDTCMNTPADPSPDSMQSDAPTTSTSTSLSSQKTTNTPSNSVLFPKTAQLSTQVIPPTPPIASSAKLPRPQLTSRLSSRSGGKRHASIGSAREVPFHLPQDVSSTSSTATLHSQAASVDSATPGWNTRLRDMGLHIPGMAPSTPNPRTPRSPRSGSMSSGAATPKSPDEHRAASYFSFRRKNSGGASPGKVRTPPTPAPPPSTVEDIKRKDKERDTMPSPIAEESSPSPNSYSKRARANLSLDLTSTLSSRGSTASLPLIGHTPIEHLVQQDDTQTKPRRGSMMAPPAAPPHVHTPPVHPPSYEYPFLPHHAPRQPLEVRVEENSPGPGMDAGSWVISVRLPGFAPDGITVGTRRGRVLMIVADNYNDDDGGHFERRISFGYDADMAAIRAEFNGDLLRVTVPRRWMFGPMGMVGRSTTIGHGPGTKPSIEQPTSRAAVESSAGRSVEATRLPGMS